MSKRGSLNPEELAGRFIAETAPVSMPDLGSVLEEINHILDFVHQEMVSRLTEEKEELRGEKEAMREGKEMLRRERDELIVKLETARAELNGIKSTIPYQIYRKTWGRFSPKSE